MREDGKVHIETRVIGEIDQAKDEKEKLDRKIRDLLREYERKNKGLIFDSVWVKRDQVGTLLYVESVIKLS